MRTKQMTLYFITGVVFFSLLGCKNTSAQKNYSEENIMKMLNGFYTSYVIENSRIPQNKNKIDSIKNQYWTEKLLIQIKKQFQEQELESDPFIKSQMFDVLILKTLAFRKDPTKEDIYYVSYVWPGEKDQTIIQLMVVKEKDKYKIDQVFY